MTKENVLVRKNIRVIPYNSSNINYKQNLSTIAHINFLLSSDVFCIADICCFCTCPVLSFFLFSVAFLRTHALTVYSLNMHIIEANSWHYEYLMVCLYLLDSPNKTRNACFWMGSLEKNWFLNSFLSCVTISHLNVLYIPLVSW